MKNQIKPEVVKLPTGLRVMFVPLKEAQTATISITVKAGAEYETKDISGMSHFLEHMFFKGTKKYPHYKKISVLLDSLGASNNAYTDYERTKYYIKSDSRHLETTIDVISEIYLNSLFKKEEIEKERGVVLEEVDRREDNHFLKSYDVFKEMIHGNQPAGWRVIGSKENIKNFSRKDFLDYQKKNYTADKTLIVVAGKFNRNKILNILKKKFSGINTRIGDSKIKTQILEQKKPKVVVTNKKTEQVNLILGGRGVNRFDKNRYAADLLEVILGGNMSSRLFVEVREELGLAYSIGFDANFYTDHGYFMAYAGANPKNVEKLVKAIKKEFKKISKTAPGIKELTKAKDFIKGQIILGLETSDDWANFYGGQYLFYDRIVRLKEVIKGYDEVKPSDIKKLANKFFDPNSLNLSVTGPLHKKEEKDLLALLTE